MRNARKDLNFKVAPSFHRQFKALASILGISMIDLLKLALAALLEKHPQLEHTLRELSSDDEDVAEVLDELTRRSPDQDYRPHSDRRQDQPVKHPPRPRKLKRDLDELVDEIHRNFPKIMKRLSE